MEMATNELIFYCVVIICAAVIISIAIWRT